MAAKQVSGRKVRYGVVGCGWIAQGYFMPGVHHTHNSEMTALVSGDPEKLKTLSHKYHIDRTYSYEQFAELIRDDVVDALYVATPNFRHTEFVLAALAAGIHVLLEKPMAIGTEDCEAMIAAAKQSGAKLMIAYRLHFEPATLAAIEAVRSGRLGDVHYFGSTFAQKVKSSSHRAQNGFEAGPVYDMGPYPINAVRNLFGTEPLEVSAIGMRTAGWEFDDTVTVTLKFPGNKVAQFMVSYNMADVDEYHLAGSDGFLRVQPGFMFGMALEHHHISGEKHKHEMFSETDHFGGETKYFSQCIIDGVEPEPDGEEGWCDVRVIEAIRQSLETGQTVTLEPYTRAKRIEMDQVEKLSPVSEPKFVNAEKPAV